MFEAWANTNTKNKHRSTKANIKPSSDGYCKGLVQTQDGRPAERRRGKRCSPPHT